MEDLITTWQLSMRSCNLSASTLSTYLTSARQFVAYLAEHHRRSPARASRDTGMWSRSSHTVETRSASTASPRFRALQQWFNWMVDEEELEHSSAERMRSPQVPDRGPGVACTLLCLSV